MKREAVIAGLASQGLALISGALEQVALWFSGKCVFDKKVHFCDNQKNQKHMRHERSPSVLAADRDLRQAF